MTQSLLWIVLNLFFKDYLITLMIVELMIWILESLLFYIVPANSLRFVDATFLSLTMNLMSFGVGWLIPA